MEDLTRELEMDVEKADVLYKYASLMYRESMNKILKGEADDKRSCEQAHLAYLEEKAAYTNLQSSLYALRIKSRDLSLVELQEQLKNLELEMIYEYNSHD